MKQIIFSRYILFKIFEDPRRYDQTVSDGELGIRESQSAPLDEIASRNNTVTQRESRNHDTVPPKAERHRAVSAPPFDPDREDSAKFQPFRNRNYKKKPAVTQRDDSDTNDSDVEYVVHHKVKRGIKVSVESLNKIYCSTHCKQATIKVKYILN